MKLGLRSAAIALTAAVCACGSTTSTPIEEHQPACDEDASCTVTPTPTPTPKDAASPGTEPSGGSSSGGSSGAVGGDGGGAGPCTPNAVCGGLSICNDPCYSDKCCDLRCTCDRDANDPDGRLDCTLQCSR